MPTAWLRRTRRCISSNTTRRRPITVLLINPTPRRLPGPRPKIARRSHCTDGRAARAGTASLCNGEGNTMAALHDFCRTFSTMPRGTSRSNREADADRGGLPSSGDEAGAKGAGHRGRVGPTGNGRSLTDKGTGMGHKNPRHTAHYTRISGRKFVGLFKSSISTRTDPTRNMARFYTMACAANAVWRMGASERMGGSAVPAGSCLASSPPSRRPLGHGRTSQSQAQQRL